LVFDFVHGDGEDVFLRGLVVYAEVEGIAVLESVAFLRDLIAIMDAGLPGVHCLPVDGEGHRLAVGAAAVGPVVIGVDLGVEEETGQQELGHGPCHASIVVAFEVAVFVGQIGQALLQFVDEVVEHRAALVLPDILERLLVGSDVGNAAEHIHQLVIEKTAQGLHLGSVGLILTVGEQTAVGLDDRQTVVAEHGDLVEIEPRVVERLVGFCPAMLIEVLPEAPVIPVTSPNGNDRLVGRERVVVVKTAHGAFESLRVAVAADIII